MQEFVSRRAALGRGVALLAGASGVLCALAADLADAPAPPAEVQSSLPPARLLGAGRLRFLGLGIYDARLWVPSGFSASAYAQGPFALELIYLRALSGKLIAERSLKEMRRQGAFSPEREQAWLQAMLQAFPDVNAGDRITGLHTPGVGARFWFNGQPRASVADAEFSRVFFGIWLADATSEPQMRNQLLGQTA